VVKLFAFELRLLISLLLVKEYEELVKC